MNERIKELAEQAGMKTISYEQDEDTHFADSIDIEKFAELIIKECIKTLEFHGFDDSIPYIEWMAKNHFDVKL